MQVIEFERFISKEEERKYFTISFEAPENAERMDFYYDYPRHEIRKGRRGLRRERNIIDLALTAADGEYVGASGSDRTHIFISSYESAQGCARPVPITPGKWEVIISGA